MTDVVDPTTRSRMMAAIRSRDTKPELRLRRYLHARGLRYRLHVSALAGRPDIVFPKFKAVVMVEGCFWHRHEGCRHATMPRTNVEFWERKFHANIQRDVNTIRKLQHGGWRVARIWECAVRGDSLSATADELMAWLNSGSSYLETRPHNYWTEKNGGKNG